jgi:hypothetical protein
MHRISTADVLRGLDESQYLKKAGLDGPSKEWMEITVKNNQQTVDRFDREIVPQYREQLKKDGWSG